MGRARRREKARALYKKIAFFIISILLIITTIRFTLSRYRSRGHSDANVDLAFYLFKEESISQELKLESILPRELPYVYDLYVANHDDTDRTETSIQYTIQIMTTTNLPLNFSVYKDDNTEEDLVTGIETRTDTDGTYYKFIDVQGGSFGFRNDEEATYKLHVTFPKIYNQSEYEGIVEYVKITIKSNQKLE
ncbi:MAG: hypothetical protein IKG56_02670 [Clostridia bacterium]|nr:hypothetical protein [Clostridia bacterium]